MTPEQERLMLEIITRLDEDAIVVEAIGYGRQEHCRHCGARGQGYYGSYEVTHDEHCIVKLIDTLRDTMKH